MEAGLALGPAEEAEGDARSAADGVNGAEEKVAVGYEGPEAGRGAEAGGEGARIVFEESEYEGIELRFLGEALGEGPAREEERRRGGRTRL